MVPTSIIEHLNVKLLLANAVKSGRLVSHTFLQTPCFFQFFSILEENCVSDIINAAFNINCKTFVGKCCKKEPLSKLYLPTKTLFFQVFQHFRRKGHVPKINERGYWYTLQIQRALPLKQSILQIF